MKSKNFGFLIEDASESDKKRFTKFLSFNIGANNFAKDNEGFSKWLKNVEEINVVAIGHGDVKDEFINKNADDAEGKHTIVTVIAAVKKSLDVLSAAKGVSNLSERVRSFRLQACYQGEHAEKKITDIEKEFHKYKSPKPITFSCPRHYSEIIKGESGGGEKCYTDTDAPSRKEYSTRKEMGTLKSGDCCTFKIYIEPVKLEEEVKPSKKPKPVKIKKLDNGTECGKEI